MVATGPAPASGRQNEYANEAALVSTDWVAEHLNDPASG